MNMPGFTGESSLYKTNGQYRAMAGGPNGAAAALTLALSDVDCTDFPDNQACSECPGGGPLDCCELKRPNDICIIKELSIKSPPTSRFPRIPVNVIGLRNPIARGIGRGIGRVARVAAPIVG
jgi:hypothetical protein